MMSQHKSNFEYTRSIKLAPAIGDWTTIQYRDSEFEEINISSVAGINFDSLPRERLKYVHYLHYRFAEHIVKKLSQDLNFKVELHTVMASQMVYEDYLKNQSDRLVQSDIFMSGIGRCNWVFEWDLVGLLVDRLTGGKGERVQSNQYTPIELAVFKTQVQELVASFTSSWQFLIKEEDIEVKLNSGAYKVDRNISSREAYVMFTIFLSFGNGELLKLTCAYPSFVLRRLLYLKKGLDDPIKQRIALKPETLKKVKVDVKAILGRATLTMKELRNLQKGDVLTLDSSLDSPIEVKLADDITLYAQPGVANKKMCTQLIFWDGHGPINELMKLTEVVPTPHSEAEAHKSLSSLVGHGAGAYLDEEEAYSEEEDASVMDEMSSDEGDVQDDYVSDDIFDESDESEDQIDVMDEPEDSFDSEDMYNEEPLSEDELMEETENMVDDAESFGHSEDEDDLFDDTEEDQSNDNRARTPGSSLDEDVNQDDDDDDFSWDDLDDDF